MISPLRQNLYNEVRMTFSLHNLHTLITSWLWLGEEDEEKIKDEEGPKD